MLPANNSILRRDPDADSSEIVAENVFILETRRGQATIRRTFLPAQDAAGRSAPAPGLHAGPAGIRITYD